MNTFKFKRIIINIFFMITLLSGVSVGQSIKRYEKRCADCCDPCVEPEGMKCLFGVFKNPTITFTGLYTTAYTFRGLLLKNKSVQNTLFFEADNPFLSEDWAPRGYIGAFINSPLEEQNIELDWTVGHKITLETFCCQSVTFDFGYTLYTYPASEQLYNRSNEIYIGASTTVFDILMPSLYVYYDFNFRAIFVEGKIGFEQGLDYFSDCLPCYVSLYSILFGGVANGTRVNSDQAKDGATPAHNGYSYGGISAGFTWTLNHCAKLSTGLCWTLNTDGANNLGGHDNIIAWDAIKLTLTY